MQIGSEIYTEVEKLIEQGADTGEVVSSLVEAAESVVPKIKADLDRRAPRMLRQHRRSDRKFHRHVRKLWGSPLDALYEVYVAAEELGWGLQALYMDEGDAATEALASLHSRACLVAREIHSLLSNGFSMAAESRARTLHETAVIAAIIGFQCDEPGTADVAVRYLRHEITDLARDYRAAVEAGKNVDSSEMELIENELDRCVAEYGRIFARDYGWAAPLFPKLDSEKGWVNFAMLEKLAETGPSRLDYRLQSHQVHASALTMAMHRYEQNDQFIRITRPSIGRVADPAIACLAALQVTTSAFAINASPGYPDIMDMVSLITLRELTNSAINAFNQRQQELDQRTSPEQRARYIRAITRASGRFTPSDASDPPAPEP
jgi:hypothetical protein